MAVSFTDAHFTHLQFDPSYSPSQLARWVTNEQPLQFWRLLFPSAHFGGRTAGQWTGQVLAAGSFRSRQEYIAT